LGFNEPSSEKGLEKEEGKAYRRHVPLSPKKHHGGRLPACVARASRRSFVPDKERQETKGKKQRKA